MRDGNFYHQIFLSVVVGERKVNNLERLPEGWGVEKLNYSSFPASSIPKEMRNLFYHFIVRHEFSHCCLQVSFAVTTFKITPPPVKSSQDQHYFTFERNYRDRSPGSSGGWGRRLTWDVLLLSCEILYQLSLICNPCPENRGLRAVDLLGFSPGEKAAALDFHASVSEWIFTEFKIKLLQNVYNESFKLNFLHSMTLPWSCLFKLGFKLGNLLHILQLRST